uniref:RdRp n=1 Tax=viral metagenome TaxID=1070528 RepID=A0A2V0RBH1_9ZZZZ
MRHLWRLHRGEFLQCEWIPNPDEEADSMFRNLVRGKVKQYMDEAGGVREGMDKKDTWVSRKEAARRLRYTATKARNREEPERMSALEQLQFHIYPGAVERLAEGMDGGGLTPHEIEAVQYCSRTKHPDNKIKQQSKGHTYTHHIYDGIRAVPRTVTRNSKGTTPADADRRAAANANKWLSDINRDMSVIAPLSINPGLHFLGRTNIKHGMRPTPASKTADIPRAHADQYFADTDPAHDPSRTIVFPGKETYLADLESTLGDPPRHTCSEAAINKAVKHYSGNLGLRRVLDDVRWRQVSAIKVNGAASSGVGLSGIGASRGQCAQSIERLAGHVVSVVGTKPVAGCGLWQLGGRGKRTTPAPGDKLKSRAVIFNDGVNAAVSSTISQSVGESIKSGEGSIKIGHRAMQGAKKDRLSSESHEVEFEIDHKRFGFRLSEPLLVTAFGMIRALLPPGQYWDYRVLHEMAHCILKTIILPGGWIYRCTFGNWSGPWTSILDSFCNWIAVTTVLSEMNFKSADVDPWFYGDDTLIGFKHNVLPAGVTPSTIQDGLVELFGIYAGDANTGRLSSFGTESGATFLGVWNKDGFHGRPMSKWVDVSVHPERLRNSPKDQMKRMAYLGHAAVCTQENRDYFTSYFQYANEALDEAIRYPPERLRQSLKRSFDEAHARFSDGGEDVREWEVGAKTTLSELKLPCRNHQAVWFGPGIGRPGVRLQTHPTVTWLSELVDDVPIGICGIHRSDVSAIWSRTS